jgi:hypothetical protein
MREAAMMDTLEYQRLERVVRIIAGRGDYPGRCGVVCECRDDIEELWQEGRLSSEQRARLVALLPSGQPASRAYTLA